MRRASIYSICTASVFLILSVSLGNSADVIEPKYPDPERPSFFKSTVEDVQETILNVNRGETKAIAISPGGRPVYLATYGDKPDLQRQANYNSAAAARDPAFYAKKTEDIQPIVYFVGPPHGQEVEGVAGLVNLIRVAETGKDWRGKEWPGLRKKLDQCRVLIIPLANPDGRARCPYNSFVGIPVKEMTRVGQGTRKDGSLYGWPGAKERHPMKDDVGILGAYFNDAGINLMHDEFFDPMTEETKAVLSVAEEEAPDYIVNLHSMGNRTVVLPNHYVPEYIKETTYNFAKQLQERYQKEGLPNGTPSKPRPDGENYPPPSFNLTSALHHVCGGVSMTYECSHGVTGGNYPELTHGEILDTQLLLYEELLSFALETPRPTKE